MGESQLNFTIDLAATPVSPGELGGKGASLARLAAAGFPVPRGFVVGTAAYRRFVDDHGLQPMLVRGDSAEIAAAFAEHRVPAEIAAEITGAYRDSGSPPVAVRSSATAEDLDDASFAGQQDSFLNISGDADVVDAVRRCWASLWNERAIIYRARQRIDPAEVAIAVVVQELVDAEASGVMFTADPVTGDDSRIEINAVLGLGEALVSGQASADTFTVDRRTGRVITSVISEKMIMTTLTGRGTADRPVPESRRHEPSITEAHASELAALGIRIAELYDSPMDIEWCRAGDELFVVQARPITTAVQRDPWNDSRTGDFLWTNTNVGEAIPDVMTPATWSMVQVFLTDAMATASIPPYVGYGRIGGRIYLNVSVMMTLSGVVGVNENRFRTLTEEVFGRLPDDLEIPPVRAHRFAVLRAIAPMALHVLGEARRDVKQLAAYLADHAELCDRRRTEIAAVDCGARAGRAVGRRDQSRVPPRQLDVVGGHPFQWCVLRHHPEATATTRRGRRRQRPDRRAGIPGRPAGQPRPVGRPGTAGDRRDRSGHLQPPLRPSRTARVRDLDTAARRGSPLDRPPAGRAGRGPELITGNCSPDRRASETPPGPSSSTAIRCRRGRCITSWPGGRRSPAIASRPGVR